MLTVNSDRFFPADTTSRLIARELYSEIGNLPIISPHGHTDPAWFAKNFKFSNAYEALIKPDHYLLRMLYSKGVSLSELGIKSKSSDLVANSRGAWKVFAENYFLFRGTPSGLWLNHLFVDLFGMTDPLDESTADQYYDKITGQLQNDSFRVQPLFDKFKIEFLATTESPLDNLDYHKQIQESEWAGNITTSYRPDPVIDPDDPEFVNSLKQFGELSDEDVFSWQGYLEAHRKRREYFISYGAKSTDHGHPSAATANLSYRDAENLFGRLLSGDVDVADKELFRAQMLTEMAKMSIDDGLVMQIHPGSFRNHNNLLFSQYGKDKGADIPVATEYTYALKPLLDVVGNNKRLNIILFTLDESSYSRELAPLAGHYPCLSLGPAWWFHDSPAGMMRFRQLTLDTAGFYNTVGFNDDTRAFLSIPVRHDMARRVDCAFLSQLVADHRLTLTEAHSIAVDLTYNLPKQAYRL